MKKKNNKVKSNNILTANNIDLNSNIYDKNNLEIEFLVDKYIPKNINNIYDPLYKYYNNLTNETNTDWKQNSPSKCYFHMDILEKLKIIVGEESRSKLSRTNHLWRNNIYDKYKQSRIKKDNFNSDIFDLFEDYLNANKFKICKYDNLEADDIVYLIQKGINNIKEMKIFIITNDGDYLQMYSNNVKIFNMQLKDLSLKINFNPATELLLKIITGDKSDNIPKIQAGMRKDNALKIALMNEDDRIKYLTSQNIIDIYNLNKKLIDLNEIPETIVKNFYEYYNISIL